MSQPMEKEKARAGEVRVSGRAFLDTGMKPSPKSASFESHLSTPQILHVESEETSGK